MYDTVLPQQICSIFKKEKQNAFLLAQNFFFSQFSLLMIGSFFDHVDVFYFLFVVLLLKLAKDIPMGLLSCSKWTG